jgi:putative ABC transport system permease protein
VVLGIALVVFVLATSLMLTEGIRRTLGQTGRADTAIILRKGSDSEMMSFIENQSLKLLQGAPGLKLTAQGKPLLQGEVVVLTTSDKTDGSGAGNITIRGLEEHYAALRSTITLFKGRRATPATNEIIIGKLLEGKYQQMQLGQALELRKNMPFTIVGVFADEGSSQESEIWGDLHAVQTAFGREGGVSAVRARLLPTGFAALKAFVEEDKRLGLQAYREPEYLERQSEGTSLFIQTMGLVIAFFFALGAMIGAMITMYASIADRRREIGTLRALGFSRGAILLSFMLEAVLLALPGGLLGIGMALPMGLMKFSMMNFNTFSEITFSLTPTPTILLRALIAAAAMGLLGGLLPAWRASRLSPLCAIRD